MKKAIILLMIVLQFFGCNSNTSEEKKNIQMVKNLLTIEANCGFNKENLYLHAKYFEKIERQDGLNQFISKLDSCIDSRKLSPINIDFNKYNILVYYTKYNARKQLDEYQEEITIENNNSVKIEQVFTGHTKDEEQYFGEALQVRLYQVDKSIQSVEMIHENETSQISMNNPSKSSQNKIVRLFVHTQGYGEEMVEIFDNNESYQIFLDKQNITQKPTKKIDFEEYRVVYRVIERGYDSISKIEEEITLVSRIKAKITDKYIRPKDMYASGSSPASAFDFLIYMVDRDIESIEIDDEYKGSIEVEMSE